MEINLIDEEPLIEIINDQKALKYDVKYNGKNINKIPVYKHWLDMMKIENGDNGIVCYCLNCHVFFYFQTSQQRILFKHRDCYDFDLAEFCKSCGELYNSDSICCYKSGYISFKRFIYSSFFIDNSDYCIMLPFISLIACLSSFCSTILSKRKNGDSIIFKKDSIFTPLIFGILLSCIYIIIFFVPLIPIYFFYLCFLLSIRKQKVKDRAQNIFRYY